MKKIKMEYKAKNKTDRIEVNESVVNNMLLSGWIIAKSAPKKKVEK